MSLLKELCGLSKAEKCAKLSVDSKNLVSLFNLDTFKLCGHHLSTRNYSAMRISFKLKYVHLGNCLAAPQFILRGSVMFVEPVILGGLTYPQLQVSHSDFPSMYYATD